jgi:UDP-2-acetamido-3-amino-2,3-dideoxy-glucuronate N-acetyltransferase
VPDHALVLGVPARIVGWMCECGEKLGFVKSRATCAACGKDYRQAGSDKVERET